MIREHVAVDLKLHGNKTKIKMSSIKDQGEITIVYGVDLRIFSIVNNKTFQAKDSFIILEEKLSIPSQNCLELQHVSHFKGLKLADITAEDIKVLIWADIPGAFHQVDIKLGYKREPIVIKKTVGWSVFAS